MSDVLEGVLATVCARSGSRGVPGKNIRPLGGRPLLAWSLECARASGCPAVVVSTDSEEIARVAVSCGFEVPFVRPPELASDSAGKLGAIRHAADWMRTHR